MLESMRGQYARPQAYEGVPHASPCTNISPSARRATDPVKARYTRSRSPSFLMRQAAATSASLEPGPPEGNAAVLRLSGRLDVYSVAAIWDAALAALDSHPRSPVIIDAAAVEYCDG